MPSCTYLFPLCTVGISLVMSENPQIPQLKDMGDMSILELWNISARIALYSNELWPVHKCTYTQLFWLAPLVVAGKCQQGWNRIWFFFSSGNEKCSQKIFVTVDRSHNHKLSNLLTARQSLRLDLSCIRSYIYHTFSKYL